MVTVFNRKLWQMTMALLFFVIYSFAYAGNGNKNITLIEMGDLHGTLLPHAAVLKNTDGTERNVASAGGLARLKTVVDRIRRGQSRQCALILWRPDARQC